MKLRALLYGAALALSNVLLPAPQASAAPPVPTIQALLTHPAPAAATLH